MAHMTEEEAARLDELYTRTTPEIDPNKKGLLSKQKETPIFVDEFTARYITAKAIATKHTPAELVSAMVRKEIAAGQ